MSNILDALKSMISPEMVSSIASNLGEDQGAISKAMGGIFPTLLSGIMGAPSTSHSMLGGLFNQAAGNSNLVGDLMGSLTGGGNSAVAGLGSSLLNGILGNKLGGIVNLLSNFAGIKSGSSSSLLGMGASLVASFLGKKMLGDGLNMGGLMSRLGGNKSQVEAALPSGFASLMGGSTANTTSHATSTSTHTTTTASTGGHDDDNKGGGMKWLLPLLLLGLLAAGLWYFLGNRNKGAEATTEITTPVVENPTTATVDTTTKPAVAAAPAVRESVKVKLVDGTELNAFNGGVEYKLVSFLGDAAAKLSPDDKTKDWYDFDNLNFDLGKATITKESMVQVENLAAILKAYPKLKIKVGGYTDKKGDDNGNLKLSQSRADAVFAALKNKGANAAQLVKAEGYGETLAVVAETAGDEERRADRKTSVRILEK
jgi:outer membrane protein OmpA-like peptidoglycan-associated protein